MVDEQFQSPYNPAIKVRDLEEGQRLMKERLLLVGQNFIESQEKNNAEITELKKQVYELQSEVKRFKNIIESISEEIAKSARKEEIAILVRQFKMFEPLEFARISDIDKIIDKKLHHHEKNKNQEDEHPHQFWAGKV